jgi:hypothetical protein
MAARRFPPPWSVKDVGAAFVVRFLNDQQCSRNGLNEQFFDLTYQVTAGPLGFNPA